MGHPFLRPSKWNKKNILFSPESNEDFFIFAFYLLIEKWISNYLNFNNIKNNVMMRKITNNAKLGKASMLLNVLILISFIFSIIALLVNFLKSRRISDKVNGPSSFAEAIKCKWFVIRHQAKISSPFSFWQYFSESIKT